MQQNKIPCVFVDTNRFISENVEGKTWAHLINLHKEKKILICISQIVRDEWTSNIRDNFISCSIKAKAQIVKQQGALKNNPLFKNIGVGNFSHNIPDSDNFMVTARNEAERYVSNFINENGLLLVSIDGGHTQDVFRKYFSWAAPFKTAETPEDFHNEGKREARKKHIPDAFIIEAILSFFNRGDDVYIICSDYPFKDALPSSFENRVCETIGDFIKLFEVLESPPPAAVEQTMPQTANEIAAQEVISAEPKADFLASLVKEDRQLMLRILGYTFWFAKPNPLTKEALSKYMQDKGYAPNVVENTAQRLVLNKVLKDTGNHYLPADIALCKQAASEITPEILELLG